MHYLRPHRDDSLRLIQSVYRREECLYGGQCARKGIQRNLGSGTPEMSV